MEEPSIAKAGTSVTGTSGIGTSGKCASKTNTNEITISSGLLAQTLRYLNHLRLDTDKLMNLSQIDPAVLTEFDARIPLSSFIIFQDAAVEASHDEYFGLHLGEWFEEENWGILGYIMMNCRSLREIIDKFIIYSNIVGNLVKAELDNAPSEGTTKILLTTPDYSGELSRHCLESALSGAVRMVRNLISPGFNPMEIGFVSPKPLCTDEYSRIFNCPLVFTQRHSYILINSSQAELSVRFPDPNLLAYFEDYAKRLIALKGESEKFSQITIKHILTKMDSGRASLSIISKSMAMSKRSLQSHLKAEGTSFSLLLQETRERIAKEYIKKNHTIEDISFLLGFADPSIFRTSFKKWTGMTPGEYKESLII